MESDRENRLPTRTHLNESGGGAGDGDRTGMASLEDWPMTLDQWSPKAAIAGEKRFSLSVAERCVPLLSAVSGTAMARGQI
jgi:hypothetical protein